MLPMKTKSKRMTISLICTIWLVGVTLPSASALPTVNVYRLQENGVPNHLGAIINDLIFSFVSELKSYAIVDFHTELVPEDDHDIALCDYVFYGSISMLPSGIRLKLVLQDQASKITRIIEKVYPTSNKILLESRVLVRDIFDQSIKLPDAHTEQIRVHDENFYPIDNLNALAGTWKGEEGIEKIIFLRGGRGIAVLTSGVSLQLDLRLHNGHLIVRQKGIPVARQFTNLPDTIAEKAVHMVPPPEWSFLISEDKKILSGVKQDSIIKNNGVEIVSVEKVELPVRWQKN